MLSTFPLQLVFWLLFSDLPSNGHKMATGSSITPKGQKSKYLFLVSLLKIKEKFPRALLLKMSILKLIIGRRNGISMVGLYQPRFSPLGLGGVQLFEAHGFQKLGSCQLGKSEAQSFPVGLSTIMYSKRRTFIL